MKRPIVPALVVGWAVGIAAAVGVTVWAPVPQPLRPLLVLAAGFTAAWLVLHLFRR